MSLGPDRWYGGFMIHRDPFGKTEFRVSDIVLGTWKAGGTDWGPQNDLATVGAISIEWILLLKAASVDL